MKKKYRMPGVIAIALAASFISIQGVGNAIEGNASPTLYTTYFYNANSVNPGRGAFNIFGNGEAGRPTLNTDIDGGRNIPDMTGETETTTAKRSFEYIPNETSTTEGIW